MSHTKHTPVATTAYDHLAGEHWPVKLTIEIDWPRLYRELARKGYNNKGGKTNFMRGIIRGTVTPTRKDRKA